jgi:hypothetical protein
LRNGYCPCSVSKGRVEQSVGIELPGITLCSFYVAILRVERESDRERERERVIERE